MDNNTVLTRLVALRTMKIDRLRALWLELYGSECPKHFTGRHLTPKLSYRIQELAYSGDSSETQARLAAHASRYCKGNSKSSVPKPGSVLVREYHGVQHQVSALADGTFQYDGCKYKSLSAIAKHITGMSWSGNAFFGLKQGNA